MYSILSIALQMFSMFQSLLDNLKKIPVQGIRLFSDFYSEISEALRYYSEYSGESFNQEEIFLKSLKGECFAHGDFLLKNIGVLQNKLFLFDFQNACCAPLHWDESYLLSEFYPEEISFAVSEQIQNLITFILKIRIGRAVRRNSNTEDLNTRLMLWRDLRKEEIV